ncbi:hypothetical protein RI138_12555 [Streptomyces sp. C11-1]|uniref:Uncharacterized protein n=1 Tax=Streptomyces durocortorensis TaxID=2811104 RepID=A0ABY9VWM3_9ACTN|nr:hypothetical protein [Streptomyces durocortorensis]WNF27599.1 hypothetical protein RI138_12555 [Streptomyces durocortorensis]
MPGTPTATASRGTPPAAAVRPKLAYDASIEPSVHCGPDTVGRTFGRHGDAPWYEHELGPKS